MSDSIPLELERLQNEKIRSILSVGSYQSDGETLLRLREALGITIDKGDQDNG